jgi:hypothetical protein
MSDYLTNVAARVLFPDRSVRPRVASVFEPQAGNGASQAIALEAPDEMASGPAPTAVHHRPSAVTALEPDTHRDNLSTPEPPVHAPRPEARVAHFPRDTMQPSGSSEATPSDGWIESNEPRPVTRPVSPSLIQSAVDVRSSTSPSIIAPSPMDSVDRSVSRPSDVRLAASPASTERREADASHVVEHLNAPHAELQPAKAPVALTRGMPMRRGRLDRHQPDAGDSPAAPAQAIHVTIGRVDVRASLPRPPRPQAAPSGASGMTLDEYLRQRAGSGRR